MPSLYGPWVGDPGPFSVFTTAFTLRPSLTGYYVQLHVSIFGDMKERKPKFSIGKVQEMVYGRAKNTTFSNLFKHDEGICSKLKFSEWCFSVMN